MATELATAYISLAPSARGIKGNIERELGGAGSAAASRTESSFRKAAGRAGGFFKSAMKGAAVAGGAALVAGLAGARSAIAAASDFNEAESKINAVFGQKGQKVIDQWAGNAASAFGQSKQQALDTIGTYGNLFTSFGLGRDQAADMSTTLAGLASDLASFNNTSVQDAADALRAGLTGETEPLKRYGVALDDASLKAKALALGIADGKKTLTPAQKAQAAYALVLERTKNAQGDFARTSGGLANQQRIFKARFDNLKLAIGRGLLPVINKLLPVLSGLFDRIEPLAQKAAPMLQRVFADLGEWWQRNMPAIKATAEQVFNRVSELVRTVVAIVRSNWPQIKTTITQVVTTVRTVIAGFVDVVQTIWKNFGDLILRTVKSAWKQVRGEISGALEIIRGVVKVVTSIIHGDWSGAWQGIKDIVTGAIRVIVAAVVGLKETLGNAVRAAGRVVRSAWSGIWRAMRNRAKDALDDVVSFVRKLPPRLLRFLGRVGKALVSPFKSAFNTIGKLWNNTLGRISFKVPGWVPKFGGKGWSFPKVPTFHQGGVIPGPPGREVLIKALAGEAVLTREQQARLGGGGLTIQNAYFGGDGSGVVRDLQLWSMGQARKTTVLT